MLFSQVRHPNIARLIGALIQQPNVCMITEFVPRGSLRGILTSTIPFPLKVKMCLDAARGVEYLHGLGILHGNLKAQNLLVLRPSSSFVKKPNVSKPCTELWAAVSIELGGH